MMSMIPIEVDVAQKEKKMQIGNIQCPHQHKGLHIQIHIHLHF